MPYQPTTKRQAFPERGASSSRQLNDFVDQAVNDLHGINNLVTANESRVEEVIKILTDESRYLKRRVSQLEAENDARKMINGRNGIRLTHYQSMYDVRNMSFFSNDTFLKPHINTTYGLAYLPSNSSETKFFTNSIYDGSVIVPADLSIEVTDVFIDPGGSTATSHEDGRSKLIEGNPKNAFNGVNNSYWVRTVEFPAESDVTEVQVQVTVTLPSQNNTMSNLMTIHPYPIGGIDIMEISTSPDLTSSFTNISHPDAPTTSTPINNSREKLLIFPPQDIDQVRLKIRQRNFIIENGKKIFRYGLQEIGLWLVDFEKATSRASFDDWIASANNENISFINKVSAPKNTFITALHFFSSDPDITLEDTSDRHVVYRIYDSDPTAGTLVELWNSNQTLPQNQPSSVGSQITLSGTVTDLYVVTSMRYAHSSGGINSPFKSNTSPYVKGFTVEYSVLPIT